MSYYPTLDEDLQRAKAILERGKTEPPDLPMPEHVNFGGTIYGGDTYAAYQLLESFVAEVERLQLEVGRLRAVDAQQRDHLAAMTGRNVQLLAEQLQFYGLFSDYEAPCTSYLQAQAIWHALKERLSIEQAEVARLRADAERERAARQVVDEALRQARARLADLDDRGAGWAGQ